MRINQIRILAFAVFATIGLASCSYYAMLQKFNTNFESGKIKEADAAIDQYGKNAATGLNRLLYFLNKGTTTFMLSQNAVSNEFFEKAYIFGEDHKKNVGLELASFLVNPNITEYAGEDFEMILLHYYKALNFIQLQQNENALVEVRRMEIKLQQLSDKYSNKNKYRRDAFIYLLMGVVYDANFEFNNAFIAYRNAYNIYKEDFGPLLGMAVPEQLKLDLLRSAYRMGFSEELALYEKEFKTKYVPQKNTGQGELVFFWNNGLGPVKTQWSFNLLLIRETGSVFFVNSDLGLAFPFFIPDNDWENLKYLTSIRITFPKYVERPTVFDRGRLSVNGVSYPFSKVEDVNGIAFKQLNDRMLFEVGKTVLRVAMKKAGEIAIKRQNQYAGLGMEIYNFISEQADTRNWQTLPHDISYSRVSLPAGQQTVTLTLDGSQQSAQNFTYNIVKNRTQFGFYHSLEHVPVEIGGF